MKKSKHEEFYMSAASDHKTCQLESFERSVFAQRIDGGSSAVENQVCNRNLKTVRYAALLIIFTNCFWLVNDMLTGGRMNLLSPPALLAIVVQVLFSIYMLVLPSVTGNITGKLVRYSFLAYYCVIIIAITVLAITKNIQMLHMGTNYSLAGISLSTLFLFIPVLAPLPSKTDSIILGAVFLVMLFVPALFPGHELYSMAQQIILRICMVLSYCYIRDVNMTLSRSISRLSMFSFTDSLTGALNRRALDMRLEHARADEERSAVGILIFDIDDFKKYNDHYSHIKGDEVLTGVCAATMEVLGDREHFLFRYGGEEFVIVLRTQSDEEILEYGRLIRKAVYDANIPRDDLSSFDRLTITIGCAREDMDDDEQHDFIRKADDQLYIGKGSGKNCVVFKGEVYR